MAKAYKKFFSEKMSRKGTKGEEEMIEPYKPLYTAPEVAKVLRININAVYDLMNKGKLPYLVLGSKKVRGSDLERFIEKYPTENNS